MTDASVRSLDLNRAYYTDCVAKVLQAHCPEVAERHAAALIGWGSEVLGNDDVHSRCYGWGPRVVLFLTEGDHARWAAKLQEILHRKVPAVFAGQPTRFTDPSRGPPQQTTDPDGHLQIPITTCQRFLEIYLGLPGLDVAAARLSSREWLLLPEAGLLRLTAGEVYCDTIGDLTGLRLYFCYFPDSVWRYRLAYQWTLLSWNTDLVGLCAHRGDTLSARIAAAESVRHIVSLVFLLNKVYKPGYLKWLHRQFYKLPYLAAEIGPLLEEVLSADPVRAVEVFYSVLDQLVAFQSDCASVSMVDYGKPTALDRGFFAYDLQPVIDALRASITDELRDLSWKAGALDQWIVDQDLLMWPAHLKALRGVYDWRDPVQAIFTRERFDHFL